MPYLIDASNLGGVIGGARGARDAASVVATLLEWARRRGRVVAVFDGEPAADVADRYGPLEIVWSGAGTTADEVIVRRLGRNGRDWIVVTDDRALAERCRALGARVEAVVILLDKIAQSARDLVEEKPRPDAADREHWSKVFGGDRGGDR